MLFLIMKKSLTDWSKKIHVVADEKQLHAGVTTHMTKPRRDSVEPWSTIWRGSVGEKLSGLGQ
jgi:hypothetical protein